jgi:aspartate aminotransferase-like enzyme
LATEPVGDDPLGEPITLSRREAPMPPIRFFLAGPTYVAPQVLQAQVQQPIAHRSAEYRAIYERCAARLQEVFRTRRPVVTATASSTLLMEAAVASTVGTRLLALTNGAFSQRFAAIARGLGREVDEVTVPLGRAVGPELVQQALRRVRYDAVTMTHCETSTGVLNPIAEIASTVRAESDALVVVDAVSSLAGAKVETDAWGLDVVLTASQKALALPPGLAFAAISERAEERMAGVQARGWYTDLLRYLKQHRDGGTISTPAATLVYALDFQLGRVLGEGMEARWLRHHGLRARTERWAASRGLELPATVGFRSPTVTTIGAPPHCEAPRIVKGLAARGYTVAGGYGDWKPSTFRIGHMGEVTEADLDGLLAEIDALLAEPG